MRGWLIFCAGSNASRTKGQYTTKAKGMERYYATLDVKTARMKLEVDRGRGGGGGGDKGAKTTTGANAVDVGGGRQLGERREVYRFKTVRRVFGGISGRE